MALLPPIDAATMQQMSPAMRRKVTLGRLLASTGASAVSGVQGAADTGLRALLAPGGTPAELAGAAAVPAIKTVMRTPALRNAALLAPVFLGATDRAANDTVAPYMNEAMYPTKEGSDMANTKYANLDEFLEKRAAYTGPGGLMGAIGAYGPAMLGQGQWSNHNPRLAGGLGIAGQGIESGAAMLGNVAGNMASGVTGSTSDNLGYRLSKRLFPLTDRIRADETVSSSFLTQLGKEMATGVTGLLKDMASKAVSAVPDVSRKAMLTNLMASDAILARADHDLIMNAFHTMCKFAPTLSTDENAARSFLREAVTTGSGPDYASISHLAKAEKDVMDARRPPR